MLLSGGIDSATCLYYLRRRYGLKALTFKYRGIAKSELSAAKKVAGAAGAVEHEFYRLPDMKEAGNSKGMPPGYIPMRNSIFYSIAASYAEENGAKFIVGGHNKDDLARLRDTSSEFFSRLQATLWASSDELRKRRTRIIRPFASRSKTSVVRLGASLGVPFELTWSCHREGVKHCWHCEGCLSRRVAFGRAGIADPLE